MLAVFVNCGAIVLGSIIGLLFAKRFTDELSDMIQTGCGIVTMIIGLQMAFKYDNIVYLALSLIIGAIIGYALDIDGAILRLGKWLEKVTHASTSDRKAVPEPNVVPEPVLSEAEGPVEGANFAYAFLNSSVLFCVGAMAIVGSFQAGVDHDYTTIFTKSILDGFISISFAAAMGVGTAFSAIMIFLYQGSLTLLSTIIAPYVSDLLITEVSACGGAIIVMIGINLLGLKKIKTANFLPALVIEIIFVLAIPAIKSIINC